MKLQILSDLHLGVAGLEHTHTDADVVVLAGDIARPPAAIAWARGFNKPVLYVPGNHEFYGSSLPETVAQLKALSAGSQVQVLDNESWVLGGVRFLGSTLWSDFRAAGLGPVQQQAFAKSLEFNRDFSRIRIAQGADALLLTPQHSARLFQRNVRWLHQQLDTPFDGPTVVVTHHAPTLHSIHPRFAGSPFNTNFVSDLAWLLHGKRTPLWIHGHTHDGFQYDVHGTQVVCNPRGYCKNDVNENPHFDPGLTLLVPAAAKT